MVNSVVIYGWILLLMGANCDNAQEFADIIKTDKYAQQIIEKLRNHKQEVSQYLLDCINSDEDNTNAVYRILEAKCMIHYLDRADVQEYLMECSKEKKK